MSASSNIGVLTSSILRGASKAIRTGKSTPIELPLTHLCNKRTKRHKDMNMYRQERRKQCCACLRKIRQARTEETSTSATKLHIEELNGSSKRIALPNTRTCELKPYSPSSSCACVRRIPFAPSFGRGRCPVSALAVCLKERATNESTRRGRAATASAAWQELHHHDRTKLYSCEEKVQQQLLTLPNLQRHTAP